VSLFSRKQRLYGIGSAGELIPQRGGSTGGLVPVTNDTAMRHSAVWACLRLRADLVSTMPVDVFRRVKVGAPGDEHEIQIEMSKPPVLVNPGGERVDICEWMYSSQVDLDRTGNAIGLITERNAANLPQRIDLQPINACSIREKNGEVKYRIDGKDYDAEKVWHERQFTIAGLPVGLSPVAYAAWSIGQYQSAQQFALNWYGTGGVPKGHFRNSELSTIPKEAAEEAKARFKTSIAGNDIFVSGKDWEYHPFQAEAVGADWLEAQKYGIGDIARFFGAPGDLIDAAVSSGSITYANITQRNLQFLIMHLGPAVYRRERSLSRLLPAPRYVKLNTSALLRMDDQTRAAVIKTKIDARVLAPSEARELDNLPPFTPEQIAEFTTLFGPTKAAPPSTQPTGVPQ
jgi:HK97 family phage portal protein